MNELLQENRHELDSEAILAEVASGSEKALRSLYDAFGALVFSIASQVLGDRQEAEEATQDVFTKIWRLARSYDKRKSSVKSWIVMLTRSASIDKLRKRSRRPDADTRRTLDVFDYQSQEPESMRSEATGSATLALKESLEMLRPEYRASIELAYFKGYSQKEIAAALKMPEGTVKSHLRRGLVKLREVFDSK